MQAERGEDGTGSNTYLICPNNSRHAGHIEALNQAADGRQGTDQVYIGEFLHGGHDDPGLASIENAEAEISSLNTVPCPFSTRHPES